MVVFFVLFVFMLLAQVLLVIWKQRHYKSFQTVTLLGLWLIPMLLSLYVRFVRMLLVWTTFSVSTGYIVWLASRRPMGKSTPRFVYTWFLYSYRFTHTMGVTGYAIVLMDFFNVPELFGLSHKLAYYGGLLLFYGLYFGVLGRDCAEMCATRMASIMGIVAHKGDTPSFSLSTAFCAICSEELNPRQVDMDVPSERVIELNCKHLFHEFCIRGWTMIGKKDICPFCSEKVELRNMFTNPWETQSLIWANLLDALRYLVVWNPLILVITQATLYILGYH